MCARERVRMLYREKNETKETETSIERNLVNECSV